MKKKIVILGASGSIGLQTLDVIDQHPDMFECIGMSVHSRFDRIEQACQRRDGLTICVHEATLAEQLSKEYQQHTFIHGQEGIESLASWQQADIIVNAIVGYAGLQASMAALKHGKTVALANKESLVIAGYMIDDLITKHKGRLIPIDSEHSGIAQCLANQSKEIRRMIITASGGSLRDLTRDQLQKVTVNEALSHPNWDMGAKITIDSATMMNKAFEVIEAHHLFKVGYDQIEAIVHPQSKVHAMIEFVDHSFIAQLGEPDMRVAIAYALSDGERLALSTETIDLTKAWQLDFRPLDHQRYPIFRFAIETAKRKDSLIASLNGANEAIIDAFLRHKISFYEMEEKLMEVVSTLESFQLNSFSDIQRADRLGREAIMQALGGSV